MFFEDEICNWIDSYIICEIFFLDDLLYDEVLSNQQYIYFVVCRKYGILCRFYYLKLLCDKILLFNFEVDVFIIYVLVVVVKEVLLKVNDVLIDDIVNVLDLFF